MQCRTRLLIHCATLLAKFWAPVPWLLEASIVLETVLHKYYEAGVIAALLVFNAALAYFQEAAPWQLSLLSNLVWHSTPRSSGTANGRQYQRRNWCAATK